MQIEISKLEGSALDWAVAKAEGFSPSTDWAKAGPIIERERLTISYSNGRWFSFMHEGGRYIYGPTPLIAAMRCYVENKFGKTIDVPDELM